MKKILLFLCLLTGVIGLNAQIYKISTYNGKTVNSCKGMFTSSQFVSAGDNGYSSSENYTVTFCSGTGTKIRANFYYIDVEAGYDKLYVYDGPSTSSPLIATLSGNTRYPGVYTSSGTCLTFRFISDGVNSSGDGWVAFLGCPPTSCGTNPPAADECSSATQICNLDGYCGSTSGWYTRGSQNLDGTDWGGPGTFSCGSIQNNSWLSFTASATTATFNITSTNCSFPDDGMQAMVFASSNCSSYTGKSACISNGIGTFALTATGLTVGQKYYIMIDGNDGNDCEYTIQAQSGIQTIKIAPTTGSTTLCSNQSLTLQATVTGSGSFSYNWSPAPLSGQGTATATYLASATTYTCTITGACGDVSATYTPVINPVPVVTVAVTGSNTICSGAAGTTLTASSTLGKPTIDFSNNNTFNIPDGTSSITSNIVVSGISGTAASQLKSVCVNVTHGYVEDVSMSLQCPDGNMINLSSDNGGSGNNYTNTCFSNSGTAITSGTPPFTGTYTPEQPLSLLNGCTANGTWSLIVKDVTSPDAGILTGWSITFQNGVTYSWSPATGLSSTTGAVVTANPGSTTTYTVTATDKIGCSGTKTQSVNVTPAPAAPGVSTVTYCVGAAASPLTATGTGLKWYTVASGGTGSSTAPTPSTASVGTKDYYVSQTVSGCESPRATISVIVKSTPASPSVTTPVTYCQNATATALTATGNNLLWYTVSSGGTGSSTAPTPSTASSGNTNYYVSQTTGGCESARALLTVTIKPTPASPSVVTPVTYCKQDPSPVPLSATGTALLWYTSSSGGTGSSTAPTPSTAVVGTTHYYVSQTTGGCESTRSDISVVINPADSALLTYQLSTYCKSGGVVSPTVSGVLGGTFSAAPAGLTIDPNTGKITLGSSTEATYVITYLTPVGGCRNSSAFTVTVTTAPNANFTYASNSYCKNAANPSPIFPPGGSAGIFSATPAGLVFVNNNTGQIDLTASAPGTYSIKDSIPAAGTCAYAVSTAFVVKIHPAPVLTNSSTATSCTGVPVNVALLSGVGSSFSWVADDNAITTGESLTTQTNDSITDIIINPTSADQVVNYGIIVTSSPANGSCASALQNIAVTVKPSPVLSTATTAEVCSGTALNIPLTSNLPAGYSWMAQNNPNVSGESTSNQVKSTIDDLLVNNTTVPQNVVYDVIAIATAGNCASTAKQITITVNPTPVLGNAATAVTCSGVPLNIALTSNVSASYNWIAADNPNTTGESLTPESSSSITNTIINQTANPEIVTYSIILTSSVGACTSALSQIQVTVNPEPILVNPATGTTVCSGVPLNIALSGTVNSTFTWIAADNSNTTGESLITKATGTINDTIINTTTLDQTVTYTVGLKSIAGGCFNLESQTLQVTVYPEPFITNPNTEAICSGVALNITLMGPSLFASTWVAMDNPNVSGESLMPQSTALINNTLINNTDTVQVVKYDIHLTSSVNGCKNVTPQTIDVTVNPAPYMTNSTTAQVCSSIPLNLALTSNIGSVQSWVAEQDNPNTTGESYISPKGNSLINDKIINLTSVPQVVKYIVTLTSITGSCLNILPQIVTVTIDPEPILTISKKVEVCSGTPLNVALKSTISANYSWMAYDNSSVTGESTIPQTTAMITDTLVNTTLVPQIVNYVITSVSTTANCTKVIPDTIQVTVNPAPIYTGASTTAICSGGTLNHTLNSTLSPVDYKWIAGDNVNTTGESLTMQSGNAINNTLMNPGNTPQVVTYTVTLIAAVTGCTNVLPQTVEVTVNPLPKADTASVSIDTSFCSASTGAINGIAIASGIAPLTYEWKNLAGIVVGTTLDLKNVGPGTYILTITDANGCSTKVGAGKDLNIISVKKVTAAFTPDPKSGEAPLLVNFQNFSKGAINYNWDFGTGSTSILKNPSYIFDTKGDFKVCLIANDGATCSDTACTVIDVNVTTVIVIPNVFTPNSDGNNDVFTITGKGFDKLDAEIYNRWGQRLYSWNTVSGGWDGYTSSGIPSESGTYFYIIKIIDSEGQEYVKKGELTLIH